MVGTHPCPEVRSTLINLVQETKSPCGVGSPSFSFLVVSLHLQEVNEENCLHICLDTDKPPEHQQQKKSQELGLKTSGL